MNTKSNSSASIPRRSAIGLILAGLTLPTTQAQPASNVIVRVKPHVNVLITMRTVSGEILTAQLSDDLTISSGGSARGYLSLDFGGGEVVEYVAERGSLTLDPAGQVTSATVLLRERRTTGRFAENFGLATLRPAKEPDECVVYDLVGPGVRAVNGEPVRFDTPGAWVRLR